MGRKEKYSYELKLEVVLKCISGKTNANHEATKYNVDRKTIVNWIRNYQSLGPDGLRVTSTNSKYSPELKLNAVLDYLNGNGSHQEICKKYGIRSTHQLHDWILKYNDHDTSTTSNQGGKSIMTSGRTTTFDERIEIVKYCIAHNRNYAETAEKFQISYQQARNYTIKYEQHGVGGLRDGRGRRKPVEELTELERLRVEVKLLRAEKERAEMEVSFLKKLAEIETRLD